MRVSQRSLLRRLGVIVQRAQVTGAVKLSQGCGETQIAELIAETQGDPLAFVMVAFPVGRGRA